MEKLYQAIEAKLQTALSICVISDIWTSKQMLDFMGLGASFTNNLFEKEVLIIGMMLMPGAHSAENIKESIEKLVNRYKFNKLLLHGMKTYQFFESK